MKKQFIYPLTVTAIATAFSFWMYFHIDDSPIAPLFVAPATAGLTASLCSLLFRKQNKAPMSFGLLIGFVVSWMMLSFGTLSGILSIHVSSHSTFISFTELLAIVEMSFIYTPIILSMSIGFLPTILIIFASLVLTTSNVREERNSSPPH